MIATTIGFIGAGNIGGTLARLAITVGFDVVLSNSRDPETLEPLVAELGTRASAATAEEAAAAGDIVVVSTPLSAYPHLPAAALAGKVVIDTTNYYPDRDGRIATLDTGETTSSELHQARLPQARIVKAFNNIDFLRLAKLAGAPERSALPIAGDDPDAKAEATALIAALGYDVVDIGPLSESWRSRPDTPVYVRPYFPPAPDGSTDDAYTWFLDSPGAVVTTGQVTDLLAAAQRTP